MGFPRQVVLGGSGEETCQFTLTCSVNYCQTVDISVDAPTGLIIPQSYGPLVQKWAFSMVRQAN